MRTETMSKLAALSIFGGLNAAIFGFADGAMTYTEAQKVTSSLARIAGQIAPINKQLSQLPDGSPSETALLKKKSELYDQETVIYRNEARLPLPPDLRAVGDVAVVLAGGVLIRKGIKHM